MDIPSPDLALTICCVIFSIAGLVTNGILVFVISLSNELRQKDYIWFIFNRAVLDFLYSLLLGALQPVAILLKDPSSDECIAAGYLGVTLGLASIYSEPFLACNRYVSILRSTEYNRIYTKRSVYLMCLASWALSVITAIPHLAMKSFGRVTGTICYVKLTMDTLVVVLTATCSFMLVGLALVLFFNFKMFWYLNTYQNQPMTNSQRTQLQSDREMLRFIFVAAFLPLFFQFPCLLMSIVRIFVPLSGWIMFAVMVTYMMSLVIDPLVTLSMVRPIRKQFVRRMRKVLSGNVSTIQIEPARGVAHTG